MKLSPYSMSQHDLSQQRVLIREDFNVPIHNGVITDDARIERALPTIKQALNANAAVILCSHMGRPQTSKEHAATSLAPVAAALGERLGQPVTLVKDYLNGINIKPGEVVLCENLRFNPGELENDSVLAQQLADLCDIVVMDAFATAHRAHASTVGVVEAAPLACFGPLMEAELTALERAFEQPVAPVVAIVGGSKVSTKIQLLSSLLKKVNTLIVGGGIANTFLKAKGVEIGASLYEPEFVELARTILDTAAKEGVNIPLPTDVRVSKQFAQAAPAQVIDVSALAPDDMILDIGPQTAVHYQSIVKQAGTIIWNGPVGVFEFPAFADGTKMLAQAIADAAAYSIAGGGDTLAALAQFDLTEQMSYISTGGGAFLTYLQGEPLPAVTAILNKTRIL